MTIQIEVGELLSFMGESKAMGNRLDRLEQRAKDLQASYEKLLAIAQAGVRDNRPEWAKGVEILEAKQANPPPLAGRDLDSSCGE